MIFSKDMLKLGFTLALYAAAACVGLAFVYTGTSEIIEKRQEADLETALRELFPEMDNFKNISGGIFSSDPSVTFHTVYAVEKNNAVIGLAIQASAPSYGGPIKVLTGVGKDLKITRVKVLEHADTPGLGANAASPSYYVDKKNKITFTGQFSGKTSKDRLAVKEDIVAITASTITSHAVAGAVKASTLAAATYFSGE
jgi:electron transport complex protein RnfG